MRLRSPGLLSESCCRIDSDVLVRRYRCAAFYGRSAVDRPGLPPIELAVLLLPDRTTIRVALVEATSLPRGQSNTCNSSQGLIHTRADDFDHILEERKCPYRSSLYHLRDDRHHNLHAGADANPRLRSHQAVDRRSVVPHGSTSWRAELI